MICMNYYFCYCRMLRIPGKRIDDVCLICRIGRENGGLVRSPVVHQPHTYTRRLLAHRQVRETRLLLCCCCMLICDSTHSTPTYLVYTQAHKHTHIHSSTAGGCHQGESAQRGCCCPMTAPSTEPGVSFVMQYHSSSRARRNINIWVSMDPARLSETRQASVRALLCVLPVRLPTSCGAGSTTTREIVARC